MNISNISGGNLVDEIRIDTKIINLKVYETSVFSLTEVPATSRD